MEKSWETVLGPVRDTVEYTRLMAAVREAYRRETVYPPVTDVYKAFSLTPFPAVQVVILGQDPYHGPGQAHGLAFSVPDTVAIPPSLRNIYQEIANDLGTTPKTSGDLTAWAKAGVLLLNSSLTVRAGEAGSHRHLGWETFTDTVISTISEKKEQVVFMVWGKSAEAKLPLIDTTKHLVLTAPHPSPLSAHRGFLGCRHFSTCNHYLQKCGKAPIHW